MTPVAIGPIEILGAAFFSTHHASAEDAVTGRERPFTAPGYALLAGRARRFTSLVTQMHIEVCGALGIDRAKPALAVFATCHGEIQTAAQLLGDVRESQMVSSARFALSVHNAASGVYSVAMGSTAATTTVTGGNAIAAGWLEAVLTVLDAERPVLLSIADEPVPSVFDGPSEPAGVAAAFLLGAVGSGGRAATLAMTASGGDTASTVQLLARAAHAAQRGDHAAVGLGRWQPGAALELCLARGDARA
jgi:hypothetical protein